MNAQSQSLTLSGSAGAIEVVCDSPNGPAKGCAVLAHPHPLHGGTLDNKVVQTLARAFVQAGWKSVRFNFRGVGASAGTHDNGIGETQDLLTVIGQLAPDGPLALAGFSFGAYVATQALSLLLPAREPDKLVLVGLAASRFESNILPSLMVPRSLVVHGESDDVAPLAAVFDWARPQALPVTVLPGTGHFFHGQLPLLKNLVLRYLQAP